MTSQAFIKAISFILRSHVTHALAAIAALLALVERPFSASQAAKLRLKTRPLANECAVIDEVSVAYG